MARCYAPPPPLPPVRCPCSTTHSHAPLAAPPSFLFRPMDEHAVAAMIVIGEDKLSEQMECFCFLFLFAFVCFCCIRTSICSHREIR